MRPSRSRGGRPRRTLDDHEIDAWIERLCRLEGDERLTEPRRQTERLAPQLEVASDRIAALGRKIGAAIGGQEIPTSNCALAARQAGLPFDPDRIERFDALPNQAGMTLFVEPALVAGTLREGWRRLVELDTAWERAVYTMFLVSEVHPFTDGNGRIARVMMNAELVAGRQSKIIVPTGFHSDYLGALRRLSRDDDPSVYVKALRFLHDYTAQIDWTTHDTAEADLRTTNAFVETDDAPRLRLLRPVPPA
jgi:hypothetical protein